MNENLSVLQLITSLVSGLLLGAIFFGGLWWTIQKAIFSKLSALFFFGSLLVRTGITLVGFYFVSGGHWERLLVCLLGFFFARFIVMRLARINEKPAALGKGNNHAP